MAVERRVGDSRFADAESGGDQAFSEVSSESSSENLRGTLGRRRGGKSGLYPGLGWVKRGFRWASLGFERGLVPRPAQIQPAPRYPLRVVRFRLSNG